MLTPQDVRSVQFEKNLRGYRTEDVDRFLDKIEEQLQQDASDRADEIESEANDKRLAEEREYDRVRLEVTRFKSDVLNLYRSHVESLSRLPEFQKDEKADADKKAADEPAEPPADAKPDGPDYDAFQGVKFSE